MEIGLVFRRLSYEKVSTITMVVIHMEKDVIMYNSSGFYSMYVYQSIPCRHRVRRLVRGLPPMHECDSQTSH